MLNYCDLTYTDELVGWLLCVCVCVCVVRVVKGAWLSAVSVSGLVRRAIDPKRCSIDPDA